MDENIVTYRIKTNLYRFYGFGLIQLHVIRADQLNSQRKCDN